MKDPKDTMWWRLVNLQPAVWRGLIISVIAVAAAFGIKTREDLPDLLMLVVLGALPILQGLWTKGAVTPNAKVAVIVPDPVGAPNKVRAGEAEVNAPNEDVIEAARVKGPFL